MMYNINVSFAAAARWAIVCPCSYILTFAPCSSSKSVMSCFRKITLSCSSVRFSYLLFRIFLSPDGIGVGMCFLRYIRKNSRGACTALIESLSFDSSTTANFSSWSCRARVISWVDFVRIDLKICVLTFSCGEDNCAGSTVSAQLSAGDGDCWVGVTRSTESLSMFASVSSTMSQ